MSGSLEWRRQLSVLVVDAHTIGGLAAVRSLGYAGYRVVATSPRPEAIGFVSRFCSKAHVWPAAEDSRREDCIRSLDELMIGEGISLIIPSEGFLLMIRDRYESYAHLLPLPPTRGTVYRSLSKYDLFAVCVARGLTQHLPPFALVEDLGLGRTLRQVERLPLPVFLKCDAVYSRAGGGSTVVKCETRENARTALEGLLVSYERVLAQGYVPGVGVGTFHACWGGRVLGEFMHQRIHEVPHTGGASSFRRSWANEEVLADARSRLSAMEWSGAGMFEYRWNPTDNRFYLIEFNSRFWGSLHLALYAGVDFPRLLADAYFGRPSGPVSKYANVASRLTFPAELGYVSSCLKDARLAWHRRLWPLIEFFLLSLDPRVRSDLWFPRDRRPYWRMLWRTLMRRVR